MILAVGGFGLYVGQSIVEEDYNLVILLGAGLSFLLFLRKPTTLLFLIPIGIFMPRYVPRLFGVIGLLEGLLPLGLGLVFARSALGKDSIRINRVLVVALTAALPVVLSAVFERGNLDLSNAYLWLGGCLTYFLGLNLPRTRTEARKILFFSACIGLALLWFDYLTHAQLSQLSSMGSGTYTRDVTLYRKCVGSIGEGNLMGAMLAVIAPVITAPIVSREPRNQRWWIFALGTVILGTLLLSRSFWYGAFIGVFAQMLVVFRSKGKRAIIMVVSGMACIYVLLSLSMPGLVSITQYRLFESTINEIKRAMEVPMGYNAGFQSYLDAKIGVTRPELSIVQLRASMEAPLWGHGAREDESRFAHAAIPTAMYAYGLFFTIPLLTLCYVWLRDTIREAWKADNSGKGSAANPLALAHLGVAVTTVGSIFFNDFFITTGQYICLALFIAGLLGSTMLLNEKRPAAARTS